MSAWPGIHAEREDTHVLRLTNKLVDLRTGYVYRHPTTPKACRTVSKLGLCPTKTKTDHEGRGGFGRVFAYGEDTHSLRLKSELFDLRSGYVNRTPSAKRTERVQSGTATPKERKNGIPIRDAVFLWRCRPDLNRRITVLQTGALPLGYCTKFPITLTL